MPNHSVTKQQHYHVLCTGGDTNIYFNTHEIAERAALLENAYLETTSLYPDHMEYVESCEKPCGSNTSRITVHVDIPVVPMKKVFDTSCST